MKIQPFYALPRVPLRHIFDVAAASKRSGSISILLRAPLIRISVAGIGNFTIIKVTIKYTFL